MALPKTITGTSYGNAFYNLFTWVDRRNGADEVTTSIDDETVKAVAPRLSNAEAVAVINAWRRASARSTVRWPLWLEIMTVALGWRKQGDRFVMTEAQAKAKFPAEFSELLWHWTQDLANQLDAAKTKLAPLYLDASWSAYQQAARDSWESMKRDAQWRPGGPGGMPIPERGDIKLPPPLDDPAKVAPRPKLPGLPWGLIIIVGLYVLDGRQ